MKNKPFNESLYKKINIANLLLFTIHLITSKSKNKCSFGEIVVTSFSLFPKTFSLAEMPKWPDSRKIDRPLR
ncbi:MAG TPA: hypothetical protein ENL27_02175, partial [Candidatus Parcubacteria bacterium]|nr:hypothetical protein [Candidatus Parcubacteria bacterium]